MKNSLFAKLEKASVIAFILLLLTGAGINKAFAQNVGINTVTPNASAMLDVVSTNSGILVPRITMAQRDAIVTPATSLLIYQTDNTPGYYYNSGTPAAPVWVRLFSGSNYCGEWTDAGTYLYPNENTNAQVYEDNNLYGFYYSGLAETPGYFISTEASVDNSAVYGQVDNTDWFGWGGIFVGGYAGAEGSVFPTGSNAYFGIRGTADGGTGDNYGVYGNAINGTNNYGVVGEVADATGFGVYALNSDVSGTGLIARGNNSTGNYLTGGSGIAATGTDIGIYAVSTAAGSSAVYGILSVADGFGVDGRNTNAAGTGVLGVGTNSTANYLTSGSGGAFSGIDGAIGFGAAADGTGLIGIGNNNTSISTLIGGSGVAGNSSNVGVYGYATATAGSVGVYGTSIATDGIGTLGINSGLDANAVGVYGECGGPGWGGIFFDDLGAAGDIYGSTKNFLIDNPENPDSELLRHTSIESPEALVVYRGKIKLNADGEAIVELPSYFVSLTKETEATVQITCVGRPFANGYEWTGDYSTFMVYGEANREISWMVMADRDDPYMQANRQPVIIKKDGSFKGISQGSYLHPELYGQPKEKSYKYYITKGDKNKLQSNDKQIQINESNRTVVKQAENMTKPEKSDKRIKAGK